MQHEFTAEIAGPRTARLLDIAIGAALVRVNRLAFTAGDRSHRYRSILLSPSRSRILLNHLQKNLKLATRWQSRTTCDGPTLEPASGRLIADAI